MAAKWPVTFQPNNKVNVVRENGDMKPVHKPYTTDAQPVQTKV